MVFANQSKRIHRFVPAGEIEPRTVDSPTAGPVALREFNELNSGTARLRLGTHQGREGRHKCLGDNVLSDDMRCGLDLRIEVICG